VFEQVRGFSGFGFPKSHAAAFGLLAYQSTWLRVHYGPELLCALFNEQPMGFYPPDSLAHEAQRRGIEVRGVDINRSEVECTVESPPADRHSRPDSNPAAAGEPAVRIGLGYVKGVAEEEARALVAERQRGGAYLDLADLASRSGMSNDGLERLAWAGTCGSLGAANGKAPRRQELWRLGIARGGERVRGRDQAQLALPLSLPAPPDLRPLDSWERIVADYSSTGVTLEEHPIEIMRPELDPALARSDDLPVLPNRAGVRVAGLVVARQRPATANGVVFMLLEDEVGVANVIVPPPVYERCRLAVRTASFALVGGRLERAEGVINLVADSVERLSVPTQAAAKVRHIEPPAERETGRDSAVAERELAAVAPRAHSFGRRG
jgi:error-prone DNA polymerase